MNHLPIAPLDGEEAWKLPGMLFRRAQQWRERRAAASASRRQAQQTRKAAKADVARLVEVGKLAPDDVVADQVAQILDAATTAANQQERPKTGRPQTETLDD